MEDVAVFAYQHDVRRQPDGPISMFDNRGVRMDGGSSVASCWSLTKTP